MTDTRHTIDAYVNDLYNDKRRQSWIGLEIWPEIASIRSYISEKKWHSKICIKLFTIMIER